MVETKDRKARVLGLRTLRVIMVREFPAQARLGVSGAAAELAAERERTRRARRGGAEPESASAPGFFSRWFGRGQPKEDEDAEPVEVSRRSASSLITTSFSTLHVADPSAPPLPPARDIARSCMEAIELLDELEGPAASTARRDAAHAAAAALRAAGSPDETAACVGGVLGALDAACKPLAASAGEFSDIAPLLVEALREGPKAAESLPSLGGGLLTLVHRIADLVAQCPPNSLVHVTAIEAMHEVAAWVEAGGGASGRAAADLDEDQDRVRRGAEAMLAHAVGSLASALFSFDEYPVEQGPDGASTPEPSPRLTSAGRRFARPARAPVAVAGSGAGLAAAVAARMPPHPPSISDPAFSERPKAADADLLTVAQGATPASFSPFAAASPSPQLQVAAVNAVVVAAAGGLPAADPLDRLMPGAPVEPLPAFAGAAGHATEADVWAACAARLVARSAVAAPDAVGPEPLRLASAALVRATRRACQEGQGAADGWLAPSTVAAAAIEVVSRAGASAPESSTGAGESALAACCEAVRTAAADGADEIVAASLAPRALRAAEHLVRTWLSRAVDLHVEGYHALRVSRAAGIEDEPEVVDLADPRALVLSIGRVLDAAADALQGSRVGLQGALAARDALLALTGKALNPRPRVPALLLEAAVETPAAARVAKAAAGALLVEAERDGDHGVVASPEAAPGAAAPGLWRFLSDVHAGCWDVAGAAAEAEAGRHVPAFLSAMAPLRDALVAASKDVDVALGDAARAPPASPGAFPSTSAPDRAPASGAGARLAARPVALLSATQVMAAVASRGQTLRGAMPGALRDAAVQAFEAALTRGTHGAAASAAAKALLAARDTNARGAEAAIGALCRSFGPDSPAAARSGQREALLGLLRVGLDDRELGDVAAAAAGSAALSRGIAAKSDAARAAAAAAAAKVAAAAAAAEPRCGTFPGSPESPAAVRSASFGSAMESGLEISPTSAAPTAAASHGVVVPDQVGTPRTPPRVRRVSTTPTAGPPLVLSPAASHAEALDSALAALALVRLPVARRALESRDARGALRPLAEATAELDAVASGRVPPAPRLADLVAELRGALADAEHDSVADARARAEERAAAEAGDKDATADEVLRSREEALRRAAGAAGGPEDALATWADPARFELGRALLGLGFSGRTPALARELALAMHAAVRGDAFFLASSLLPGVLREYTPRVQDSARTSVMMAMAGSAPHGRNDGGRTPLPGSGVEPNEFADRVLVAINDARYSDLAAAK